MSPSLNDRPGVNQFTDCNPIQVIRIKETSYPNIVTVVKISRNQDTSVENFVNFYVGSTWRTIS